jgi:hypothetical protein
MDSYAKRRNMKHLYLDIDGTIITKKEEREAKHLVEFLAYAVDNLDCNWLTSHCQGDVSGPLDRVRPLVSDEAFELLRHFKPTRYHLWKTEAIDLKADFIWLDDYVFDGEKRILEENNVLNSLFLINLESNPNQFLDILETLKKSIL